MRKLFLFIALTLSAGLWATTQIVSYRYPVYNTTNNPYSGIKEWKTKSVEATVVENSSSQVTWNAGWYVVTGTDVQLSKGAVCAGDVCLILADGAKLTATGSDIDDTPGIQVSGEGNSLTIYAQSTGDQMGKLTATGRGSSAGIGGGRSGTGSNITINGGTVTATSGDWAAGIGGGFEGNGEYITINGGTVKADGGDRAAGIGGGSGGWSCYITINGGTVTATGGVSAAGIGSGFYKNSFVITINGGTVTATGGNDGAGIGGGYQGSGSEITINGGTVKADGGDRAAGIGGGYYASGNKIKVATYLIVKAGNEENPTEEIATDRTDDTYIENDLAGKRYVTTEINFSKYKTFVIAAVNAKIAESDNDNVKAIATNAATAINAATTEAEVNTLKNLAIANITSAKAAYTAGETAGDAAGYARGLEEGKAAGLAEAAAALPTDPEGTAGHTVTITKGDKTLILVNPDKVTYGKQE